MDTTILIAAKIVDTKNKLYLKAALASCQNQGTVIVGFNQCEIPVKDLAKEFPDVTFCTIKNVQNLAQVRNALVAKVKSKFFFFLDHDDILPEDAITIAEREHPGLGWYVYGKTILFSENSTFTYPAHCFSTERLLEEVYFPNGVLHWTDNLKTSGTWDESMPILEDKEFWIRSAKAGVCGFPIDYVLYKYRTNLEGLVATKKGSPEWTDADVYIKIKHTDVYKGEPMGCKSCGKKSTSSQQPSNTLGTRLVSGAVIPGKTQVHYNLKTGKTVYYGPVTRTPYIVSATEPVIYIYNDDMHNEIQIKTRPGLLDMWRNGQQVFTVL